MFIQVYNFPQNIWWDVLGTGIPFKHVLYAINVLHFKKSRVTVSITAKQNCTVYIIRKSG